MPRAFSSGALSIWSKADASLRSGYLSCSTLVIAAVKVVLPWSMCPMVPMLTCGLVRSNFAFATVVLLWDLRTPFGGAFGLVGRCFSLVPVGHVLVLHLELGVLCGGAGGAARGLLSPGLGDDLQRDVGGDLRVGVELHGVARPALGLAAEVSDIAEHL